MATEAAHQWQWQQTTVDNCRSGIPVDTLAEFSNKPEQQLDNNKLCYGIIKHYPPLPWHPSLRCNSGANAFDVYYCCCSNNNNNHNDNSSSRWIMAIISHNITYIHTCTHMHTFVCRHVFCRRVQWLFRRPDRSTNKHQTFCTTTIFAPKATTFATGVVAEQPLQFHSPPHRCAHQHLLYMKLLEKHRIKHNAWES